MKNCCKTKKIKMIKIELRFLFLLLALFAILLVSENAFAQATLINSTGGNIENEIGIIKIKTTGSLIGLQDTIGGTIIFLAPESGRRQVVPNITYNKLILNANAWLYIDSSESHHASSRPMSVLDSLIVLSGEHSKIYNNSVETHTSGNIYNNGRIRGLKDVRMNNQAEPQAIDGAKGKGSFSRLNINNPFGVEVASEFEVTNKLELTQGTLKNTSGANVKLGNKNIDRNDTADVYLNRPLIVRHTTGSMIAEPILDEPQMSIHYVGQGSMFVGAEAPTNALALHTVRAENTDSLILSKNLYVADSLFIGTHIHTSSDTLILFSAANPQFHLNNPNAEIYGNFRRTDWFASDKIFFNNPMTYLFFNTPVNKTDISQITSTIYPREFSSYSGGNMKKVKRNISMHALNMQGEKYQEKIDAVYGYGWRHQGEYDETMDLAFEKLILMHYDENAHTSKWIRNQTSVTPSINNSYDNWGYSYASKITGFGNFAIGLAFDPYLTFRGKVLLEGAYRYDKHRMANDLQQRNYLPMPPQNVYPYNKDPNMNHYARRDEQDNVQFPDSVVDWVVVEFRKEYSEEGSVKTLLVKTDGRIVDMWGNEQVFFTHTGEIVGGAEQYPDAPLVDSVKDANFYVAILHRNHTAMITALPIEFIVGNDVFVDFTSPQIVLGGTSALKPIGRDSLHFGQFIYGMIAGDFNPAGNMPDGKVDENDYRYIIPIFGNWSNSTFDGYLLNDINLNGTITTLDFNMVYNNRGRISFYPHK